MKKFILSTIFSLSFAGIAVANCAVAVNQVTPVAQAKKYSPEALRAVIVHAAEMSREGQTPVVLFDLDDTLINTRERTLRILRDFATSESSLDAERISLLTPDQIQFSLNDTLKSIGLSAPVIQRANDFWATNFFTNKYCSKDVPNPGAVKYVQILARAGAKIVYLTGRDTPRMGEGTREDLINLGFPMNPEQAVLILKPDQKQDDVTFKKSVFDNVKTMGEVTAAFENEPANINAMADAFPKAQAIFLDTIHSDSPDVPELRVQWVKDFELH